ncbi:mechanosensitive ion channel [Leptolyngbya cf. ectocarpi LEGE 11479]|uniref:Mechanosensitive ion channel n=1 Tax=Leptolyngbya cf. ectocarpi LEGE 11479 TaxID=1828722 RepID=A0A928ZQQ0_LEPEC|nr:mechanosensitive ion channel domain-containing protein [Leptolyngbya ectocarpi]MBE9065653.1 mechanosensitive ion channel [Leptolyngbya cf. ectocarpi LEGE 11479]
MDNTLWIWVIVLAIAVPITSIVLGDVIETLERQHSPLAVFLRKLRIYLLPTLAALLVLEQVLDIQKTATATKLVGTAFWIAVIITLLALLNAIFTSRDKSKSWQIYVSNLFFQTARGLVLLTIVAHILGHLWGFNLGEAATALGVGSLVIALALQDTFSSLVSGLLLLFSNPFKVGDWIACGDVEGRVIDMNWRAVTLSHYDHYLCVIPNGTLASETIINYSLNPHREQEIEINFSFDDSPGKVLPILERLTEGIAEIRPGSAEARIVSYGESAINYVLEYCVEPEKEEDVSGTLYARLYYAAKRHRLTIPYPIKIDYKLDASELKAKEQEPEILDFLQLLPSFQCLDDAMLHQIASEAMVEYYGIGETILRMGESNQGLHVILHGIVQLFALNIHDQLQEVTRLERGAIFGEMAIFPGEVSPVSVAVVDDLTVVVIPTELLVSLIQRFPQFALAIDQLIKSRRKLIDLAKGYAELSQISS